MKKNIFVIGAFLIAIGGAVATKVSAKNIQTTYYDKTTVPGSCSPTSCITSPLHPQCTQQFWSDNICSMPVIVTLYKPN